MRLLAGVLTGLLMVSVALAAEEQIVLSQSANGTRSLRPFEVKPHWEIRWQSGEALAVSVFRANMKENDPLSKLPIASGSQTKGGKGATYIPDGGHYYLQVLSMGDWTITVVQLP